jgi:hypothetical protein
VTLDLDRTGRRLPAAIALLVIGIVLVKVAIQSGRENVLEDANLDFVRAGPSGQNALAIGPVLRGFESHRCDPSMACYETHSIYRRECLARVLVRDAMETQGPAAAFLQCQSWIFEPGASGDSEIKRIVALRALPSIAGASADPHVLESVHSLLLNYLETAANPIAARYQALAALNGTVSCNGAREPQTLMPVHVQGFPKSKWTLEDICSDHVRYRIPVCGKDPLTTGGIYVHIQPHQRFVHALRDVILSDPPADLEQESAHYKLSLLAYAALQKLDPSLMSATFQDWLRMIDSAAPMKNGAKHFLEVVSSAYMDVSQDNTHEVHGLIRAATRSRSPEVRVAVLEGLTDLRRLAASWPQQEFVHFIESGIALTEASLREGAPTSMELLLETLRLIGLLDTELETGVWQDKRSYADFEIFMARLHPLFLRALEVSFNVPDAEPSALRLLASYNIENKTRDFGVPLTAWIGGERIPLDPSETASRRMFYQLPGFLQEHSDNPVASNLLAEIMNFRIDTTGMCLSRQSTDYIEAESPPSYAWEWMREDIRYAAQEAQVDPERGLKLLWMIAEGVFASTADSYFKSEVEYGRFLDFQDQVLPFYRETLEAALAAPGEGISNAWYHHLELVANVSSNDLRIGDQEREFPSDPPRVIDVLLQTLQANPDSVRSQIMLDILRSEMAKWRR